MDNFIFEVKMGFKLCKFWHVGSLLYIQLKLQMVLKLLYHHHHHKLSTLAEISVFVSLFFTLINVALFKTKFKKCVSFFASERRTIFNCTLFQILWHRQYISYYYSTMFVAHCFSNLFYLEHLKKCCFVDVK